MEEALANVDEVGNRAQDEPERGGGCAGRVAADQEPFPNEGPGLVNVVCTGKPID